MFAARRLNDGMGAYVAEETIKCMNKAGILVKNSNILILGFTFKENCPDVRNTKVIDIYHTLCEYTPNISIFDPWANPERVKHEYNVEIYSDLDSINSRKYDAVILSVAHKQFKDLDIRLFLNGNGVVYDVKGVLPKGVYDARL